MMSSRSLFFLAVTTVLQSQAAGQVSDPLLPGNSQPDVVGSAVADTAALIGVSLEIELLRTEEKPGAKSSQQSWRILSLHQRIYERVMMASLQVDSTIASIDNEIARSTEVRGFLADKRDRDVTRANLFSALLGGGLGATSAGLQLSSKQTNGTAATGIAGGAIAAGLSLYGIHAQRGGARILNAESNMLAEFFDRPELPTSHYPAVIWAFLGQVAPTDPDHLTRRERLLRTWLELKRLDSLDSASGRTKVQHVTSMPDQHLKLTVDDLEDRIAMLQDVRAKLSYLKRDLALLLASLPSFESSAAPLK
jgi:uncharacterized small protein (DUF1192 family)